MDIKDLSDSLTVLQHNGVIFATEERFRLEMGLQKLLNSSKAGDFEELLFWGRISGKDDSYYIAVGLQYNGRYEFPQKKFFWATTKGDYTFEAFPALNDWHSKPDNNWYLKNAHLPFLGQPTKVHVEVEKKVETEEEKAAKEARAAARTELDDTEEEDPMANIVINDLTEIDRLLYHVQAIDFDCAIVPQGSMKLTVAHEVQRNEAFAGLTVEDLGNLANYSHFRVVQNAEKRELLEADEAIFKTDFLENVATDEPKGCWSI